ncbi:MAG: UDP-3-O-[3-hydroxymyristoyl] N-acetylglucosamine deacetylase [Bacteroidales bacterium]|nr:UDP-3-O-[3-hydroxymyristoyl] N-acetylglucosamine deacetylase [Bacteroidales bacterium]
MNQQTLKKEYFFEGKGLHTGVYTHMTLKPAVENSGIVFVRTDLGVQIPALAENVTNTARCTLISKGEAFVSTIEHIMSAFTGLGVDNAIVELDNGEVPILDGSARFYAEAIVADGLQEQKAERKYFTIPEEVEIKDEKTGSWVKVTPADELSYDITVDFGSRVLGVQTAHWDEHTPYAAEVAPCRTFCFFHEVQYLASQGLVKGGDVDNAIVVVEHPVDDATLEQMARLFGQPLLKVTPEGYLSNLVLRFPNECGRHKLLDLIGDMRLAGGYLRAHITAYKPGHTINTNTAKAVQKLI